MNEYQGELLLGHLVWWRVAGDTVSHDDAAQALGESGALPDRPIPIDVFRRITGSRAISRYTLPDGNDLELSAVAAEPPNDKMLVRHMVAKVTNEKGIVLATRKVGDAVFYRPPRGQNHKSRMRITSGGNIESEWEHPINAYVASLRQQYERGVAGSLDVQGVRRLVRNTLNELGALYLDGPYFVLDTSVLIGLRTLFDRLGQDSFIHTVPLPNEPDQRALIARAIERAVASGATVDDHIWARLEGAQS